jgi:hypothetical protein
MLNIESRSLSDTAPHLDHSGNCAIWRLSTAPVGGNSDIVTITELCRAIGSDALSRPTAQPGESRDNERMSAHPLVQYVLHLFPPLSTGQANVSSPVCCRFVGLSATPLPRPTAQSGKPRDNRIGMSATAARTRIGTHDYAPLVLTVRTVRVELRIEAPDRNGASGHQGIKLATAVVDLGGYHAHRWFLFVC